MKIVHTGDWHFEEAKHRRPGADGVDQGWHDVATAVAHVVDHAIACASTEPTVLFFGGDLARSRKPSPHTYRFVAQQFRRLHAAGVPVVLGTDAGNPLTLHGPSVFVELEAMQAAGLTPREVLTAATRDAAQALGRSDLGRIEVGAVADLLVLGEDPGTAAKAFRSLQQVCRAGVLQPRDAFRPQ